MSQAAARIAAIQERDRAAAAPAPEPDHPPVRIAGGGRTRPVRQTVDLSPDQYAALASWRIDTALAVGRTRITTQEVLATTVAALLDDETVARRVRARLAEAGDQ